MDKIDWKNHLVELVVVFIGITAAFALNNWNEKNKEEKLEYEYLVNIKTDLEEDIKTFEKLIGILKTDTSANSKLINFIMSKETPPKDSLFSLIQRMNVINKFQPQKNTFESLKSSGGLSLISDFYLKKGLTEVYNLYNTVKEIDDAHYKVILDLWVPYFYGKFDLLNYKNSKMDFINNIKFKNTVVFYRSLIFQQIQIYDSTLTKCKELKTTIDRLIN